MATKERPLDSPLRSPLRPANNMAVHTQWDSRSVGTHIVATVRVAKSKSFYCVSVKRGELEKIVGTVRLSCTDPMDHN